MRRSIILTAGNSCFVACPGCYNNFARTLLATPVVHRFAELLHRELGVTKITVGGGDPLTRPDIEDLVSGLREIGLTIHLDTVGTAFLRDAEIRFMGQGTVRRVDIESLIRSVDQIGIPLDGSTDDVARRFRRFGSVADQLAILDLMDSVDATVCVNTVVHQGNIDDLESIAEQVECHPAVRRWQLFQFMPSGPLGSRQAASLSVSPADFERAVSTLDAALPEITVSVKSNSDRKNSYLLIDGAGTLWSPRQQSTPHWSSDDESPDREVHGWIGDIEVIEVLRGLL
ncbi:radical SAM protein [Frankia sp. AgPm24]|uniref:radical SAM protein n=1 Tax=Frankia sp. AgPm24 TaxID=631128 RepID=UPI00200ED19B|nr:radical SAM protein [Frankia sp. AgPm24]MCK9923341.1 radical SAM protein [Frankia sp. AgPm24]